jgi:hypothetical protein
MFPLAKRPNMSAGRGWDWSCRWPRGKPAPYPLTGGVLTGPRGWLMALAHLLLGRLRHARGDVVEGHAAVWLLGEKDPEAAAWWRENAPHTLGPASRLVFPAEVCQEALPSAAGSPPPRSGRRRPGGEGGSFYPS